MNKVLGVMLLLVVMTVLPAAADAADPEQADAAPAEAGAKGPTMAEAIALIGASLGAAMCAIGGGYAISRIGGKCIEAIARQPEAAGTMFAPMIVSAAMVEGGMLFAIVVCLLAVMK